MRIGITANDYTISEKYRRQLIDITRTDTNGAIRTIQCYMFHSGGPASTPVYTKGLAVEIKRVAI